MTQKILTERDFVVMPWKNGLGSTTEMYRIDQNGRFIFRVSSAKVLADGPFSDYQGYERVLINLGPGKMRLSSPIRTPETLEPFSSIVFDGAEKIYCSVSKPTLDFNVFSARSVLSSTVVIHELKSGEAITRDFSGSYLLFMAAGFVEIRSNLNHRVQLDATNLIVNDVEGQDATTERIEIKNMGRVLAVLIHIRIDREPSSRQCL